MYNVKMYTTVHTSILLRDNIRPHAERWREEIEWLFYYLVNYWISAYLDQNVISNEANILK